MSACFSYIVVCLFVLCGGCFVTLECLFSLVCILVFVAGWLLLILIVVCDALFLVFAFGVVTCWFCLLA